MNLFTLRLRPVNNSPASSLTKFSRAVCLSVTLLAESISCSYINSFPLLELLPWLRAFLTKLTPVNSSKLSLSKNSFAFLYRLFCTQEMLSLCRQSSKLWPATTTKVRTAIANIFMTFLERNGKSRTEINIYTRVSYRSQRLRRKWPPNFPETRPVRSEISCGPFVQSLYLIYLAGPSSRAGRVTAPHPVSFFFLFAVARDVSSQ